MKVCINGAGLVGRARGGQGALGLTLAVGSASKLSEETLQFAG